MENVLILDTILLNDGSNEDAVFHEACCKAEHLQVVKTGERYFTIYFGPEHDSWNELT